MTHAYNIQAMAQKIAQLKQMVLELKEMSGGIMAVDRNAERMLASIRLLELDICDVVDIL
jgi:hypothetical protein